MYEVESGHQSLVKLLDILVHLGVHDCEVGYKIALVLFEVLDAQAEFVFKGNLKVHEHIPE